MSNVSTIDEFHAALDSESRKICDTLRAKIDGELTEAEAKVWHAHPVWFLSGNPIVGYSRLKDSVRLMFWSGQSFNAEGLHQTGSFKAAEARYKVVGEIDQERLVAWLRESREIQWDYKNIQKRKGRLERLK